MSHELKEGAKLRAIWWHESAIQVGVDKVVSIIVREQMGQMGMVPWVTVTTSAGRQSFYNCALLEGFDLLDECKTEGHDFKSRGDGTAYCKVCGEHADVTETGAAR